MRGPILMHLSPREAFVVGCLRHLGEVVFWGDLDCSDLVARGEIAAGLPDRRGSHTAQRYAFLNREDVKEPELGDLCFFGRSWAEVVHVAVSSFGGQVLSADGATHAVQDRTTAAINPHARVRLHPDTTWYRGAPFLGWRRHHELDQ